MFWVGLANITKTSFERKEYICQGLGEYVYTWQCIISKGNPIAESEMQKRWICAADNYPYLATLGKVSLSLATKKSNKNRDID